MKTIPLTQGRVALVDDCDFEMLSHWSWCFDGAYAVRGERRHGRQVKVYLHRMVALPDPSHEVDHANRNRLDNRRANLRQASDSQNNQNRSAATLKGVSFDRRYSRPWRARIQLARKRRELGRFSSARAAAIAYDAAACEHFGEFAALNFPERTQA